MANEISIQAKLSASKGGATITNATSTKSLDMAGSNMLHVVVPATATPGTYVDMKAYFLAAGINTAAAYQMLVRNTDSVAGGAAVASSVTLAVTAASTYAYAYIAAGSFAFVTVPAGKGVFMDCTVASVDVEILVCEV